MSVVCHLQNIHVPICVCSEYQMDQRERMDEAGNSSSAHERTGVSLCFCVWLCVPLFASLAVSLSVFPSVLYLSIQLSFYIFCPPLHLSCLHVPPVSLLLSLSLHLPVFMSVCLSVSLSVSSRVPIFGLCLYPRLYLNDCQ